jgi:hypothetical protein
MMFDVYYISGKMIVKLPSFGYTMFSYTILFVVSFINMHIPQLDIKLSDIIKRMDFFHTLFSFLSY